MRTRKECSILFICMIMVLIMPPSATAATHYVDATKGNDVQDGLSPEKAWKTIKKVKIQTFNPGDEIRFKRGEVFDGILFVYSSGAEGKPIVFREYGNPKDPLPIITYSHNFCIWMRDESYLVFQNLEVAGGGEAVIELKQSAKGKTHNIVIKDCTIRGGKTGIWVDTAAGGIVEGCEIYNCGTGFSAHDPGFTVRNCRIHDNKCGISVGTYDTIIEGNEIYNNDVGIKYGWGYGKFDVIFRYNLIRDNNSNGFETLYGVVKAGSIYYNIFSKNGGDGIFLKNGVSGINIYNNVVYGNGANGIHLDEEKGKNPSAITIKNNILMDNRNYEIKLGKAVTGLVSDYNCVYHSAARAFMHWCGKDCGWEDWKRQTQQDIHSINKNPLFVNKAANDFKLKTNSPCINSGVNVGLQGVDYYENPITSEKYDIGVQETQAAK